LKVGTQQGELRVTLFSNIRVILKV
jgi:hypothetical protein